MTLFTVRYEFGWRYVGEVEVRWEPRETKHLDRRFAEEMAALLKKQPNVRDVKIEAEKEQEAQHADSI